MIEFSVFLARLLTFCLTREAFQGCIQAPVVVPPSDCKDLTPELISQWDNILAGPGMTASEKYRIECKITDLECAIKANKTPNSVKGIALKELVKFNVMLESYREPVPLEPAALAPKKEYSRTDYSGIELQALEIAQAYLLEGIQAWILRIEKAAKLYSTRTELIEAGVWDWRKPLFACPIKGKMAIWRMRLNGLKWEAGTLEYAIAYSEKSEDDNREVPDVVSQWSTSGVPGPGADAGEDTRRFPALTGNFDWRDIGEMSRQVPTTPILTSDAYGWLPPGHRESMERNLQKAIAGQHSRKAELEWHNRVNGVNFTTPTHREELVGF